MRPAAIIAVLFPPERYCRMHTPCQRSPSEQQRFPRPFKRHTALCEASKNRRLIRQASGNPTWLNYYVGVHLARLRQHTWALRSWRRNKKQLQEFGKVDWRGKTNDPHPALQTRVEDDMTLHLHNRRKGGDSLPALRNVAGTAGFPPFSDFRIGL